ncbi:aldose 1-epimerase [Lactobacillus hamsteri]|uniref:Aldose 1-epimerase n=1 Tax=Lactobacillus hamsteri DSM 5661 = JCM 6256 TaxID=1423754 RepID=A0A0R1YIT5_9LACO|nr:aldose epimerase [Lactobacillus hamsteri]KRM39606.1 hypothetical protein FC39_GL001028 [Lactobacillus hamsteri DSM 5661 = JCM 6256]
MQTIENSLLQVSVDENGAGMNHLVSQTENFDYLQTDDKQETVSIAFSGIDHDNNWALDLPWTVVDKGDARVSLTLIDTPESYKKFPYHFEVMVTYTIEGNQVKVSFLLKNNSNKEMPFSLELNVPIIAGWDSEKAVNSVILKNEDDHTITIEPTDFKVEISEKQIDFVSNKIKLAGETKQNLELSFTIA